MTLVTEKEAAEKLCPKSAHPATGAWSNCIGSRCMAWRVSGKRHSEQCETIVLARKAVVPKCNCAPVSIGYCGAFGKVEP